MDLFVIATGVFFTLISVVILSYVSIATMLGPWIAPTLVLLGGWVLRLRAKEQSVERQNEQIVLMQAIGAGGGAIATGVGFALPILYFLDQITFNRWLADPLHFCVLISVGCLAAGSFGILLGRLFASSIIQENKLPFPVSKLTYSVLTSQARSTQAARLFTGVWCSMALSFCRDGLFGFKGFLPRTVYLFERFFGSALAFSFWPTLWAIGFTIGFGVALPLMVGILSKYLILYPLNMHSLYLPINAFPCLKEETFVTAFCAGLVLAEFCIGVLHNPTQFTSKIRYYFTGLMHGGTQVFNFLTDENSKKPWQGYTPFTFIARLVYLAEPLFAVISSIIFFSYLNFSYAAQIVFFLLVALATYEISYIGCEIGLVQYGRFSAFVLIPMFLVFGLNFVQLTAVCVFFNICAATASDLLFDYKIGSFCNIQKQKLHIAQWIGLITTALSIGCVLYLLFTSLKLGSVDLFAQRGRSKALLIQSLNLNYFVVACGFLYGIILKRLRISPTMTFGGIIMPNNISIGLLIGIFCSYFVKNKEDFLPFCSGVFASESLWIIVSTALKMF